MDGVYGVRPRPGHDCSTGPDWPQAQPSSASPEPRLCWSDDPVYPDRLACLVQKLNLHGQSNHTTDCTLAEIAAEFVPGASNQRGGMAQAGRSDPQHRGDGGSRRPDSPRLERAPTSSTD